MMSEEPEWRQCLLLRLRERNRKETESFKDIILQNNRLLDSVAQFKADNLKLSIENEKLRTSVSTGGGKDVSGAQMAIAALEKKLLEKQEELTDLHKRKGENAQHIVDLNVKVEKQNKAIIEKDKLLAEQIAANNTLRVEVQMLKSSLEELKKLNTTIKDEHTALHLAFTAQSEKLRSVQEENQNLLQRIMVNKSKDADKLNEENESFIRKRSDKVKRELEDAVREPSTEYTNARHRNSLSPSQFADEDEYFLGGENGAGGACGDHYYSGDEMANEMGTRKTVPGGGLPSYMSEGSNPTTIFMKFDAHDNESHAVRWSPIERTLATGGSDRKVKLWDIVKGSPDAKAVLGGSSAGINSVDFDSTGNYLIGTSNDYGARVWTVVDSRLRHTLTGHSGKVMAAKYLQEPIKVVTGSYDRTLKIWDLRSIACIETKFAGSSCNDLVTTDSLGSTIISAHLDKKIRFWDIRTEKQADDVLMANKITSLDLSKDCNYLICTVRDDTIKMLDLRKNQVTATFSNENFKLSCDWARASLNPNGTKIACGSSDGLIYIWNIYGQLETTLKGHSTAVNAVSWSPNANAIASVGKSKRCIIYVDS